jgi:transcriptional regulator with XRE-family HTH domain
VNSDTASRQMATVGERIRQRRLDLGLSQRELASEGVFYAYISRLESNARQPSINALRKLALKLGVSPYWLETGDDDPVESLARLVLEHPDRWLPRSAQMLARSILSNPR